MRQVWWWDGWHPNSNLQLDVSSQCALQPSWRDTYERVNRVGSNVKCGSLYFQRSSTSPVSGSGLTELRGLRGSEIEINTCTSGITPVFIGSPKSQATTHFLRL